MQITIEEAMAVIGVLVMSLAMGYVLYVMYCSDKRIMENLKNFRQLNT
jgi:hypothetical protein